MPNTRNRQNQRRTERNYTNQSRRDIDPSYYDEEDRGKYSRNYYGESNEPTRFMSEGRYGSETDYRDYRGSREEDRGAPRSARNERDYDEDRYYSGNRSHPQNYYRSESNYRDEDDRYNAPPRRSSRDDDYRAGNYGSAQGGNYRDRDAEERFARSEGYSRYGNYGNDEGEDERYGMRQSGSQSEYRDRDSHSRFVSDEDEDRSSRAARGSRYDSDEEDQDEKVHHIRRSAARSTGRSTKSPRKTSSRSHKKAS